MMARESEGRNEYELSQSGQPANGEPVAGGDSPVRVIVGLDIGGTKTAALVVGENLRPLSQLSRPTDVSEPAKLVASVTVTVREALAKSQADLGQVAGIGVAVPGLVDPARGVVELAVNLNLEAFPLAKALSAELGVPCYLDNDVRTAAVGAYQYVRQQQAIQHLAYLSVGTGIAAGVILGGRLYRGANGMAGEIGHVIFEPDGPRCGCGMPGCLEAVASGTAIARLGREVMAGREENISAATVYDAARQGNEKAQIVVHQVSRHLARAIQLLIMTYDVERVVLGGGVTKAGQFFLDPILAELARLRAQSSLAEAMLAAEKVLMLPADYNAGVWGAIKLTQHAPDISL